MLKLLNYFLNGLLYILLSPFIVAFYALKLVQTILIYTGGEIIALFSFLGGKKYQNEDELSKKLEKILEQPNNIVQPQTQSNIDFNYAAFNKTNTPVDNNNTQTNPQVNVQHTQVNVTPVNFDETQARRGDHA
jgi:hypothetical protein